MRLGIVSDAHGNAPALGRAIAALAGVVDEIVFAGDAFSDHRFSNETVEMLRGAHARCITGNHEMSLLGRTGATARHAPHVRATNLEWVASLPARVRTSIGGRQLLAVHGSPWEPAFRYLTEHSPELERCSELDVDILVLGHSHIAFSRRVGRTLVVNPGSVGRADGPNAGDLLSFAALDTSTDEVTFHTFPAGVV